MHRPFEELDLVMDPSAWGFNSRPNKEVASKEFDELVDLLESENVKVDLVNVGDDVPPPNLYYTGDLGICTSNGFVLAYFRHEYRPVSYTHLTLPTKA